MTTARVPALQPIILRGGFALFILFFAVGRAAVRYVNLVIPTGGDPWMVGDWLINYGGGFVRRGLFGELFLALTPPGNGSLWILFALQMACYLVMLSFLVSVLHRTRYSWSSIALVCGPAGLAYIGWVPSIDGAFRKEILALAALALLAWARSPGRGRTGTVTLTAAGLALYVLAVFSWEPSALLVPAVVYLLVGGAGRPDLVLFRRSAAVAVTIVAGFGAVVSVLWHGDVAVANAICDAVRAHDLTGPVICSGGAAWNGGAIEAIGWTSYKTAQDLAIAIPPYVGFLPLVLLALVPVAASAWFRRHWGWAVVIVAAVAPLYFIVTDYGRWTHLLVLALTFCITADDPHGGHSSLWNPVGAVAYTALWGMPHWMGEAQLGEHWWPFVGLLPTVLVVVNSRLLALSTAGSAPTVTIGPALDFSYVRHFFEVVPAHGWDSWFPVMLAMRHMDAGGQNLYETIFFGQGVKFQYPTTSLLFIEPFWALWPNNIAWPLNALGWLAVIATGFFLFRILQRLLGESTVPYAGLAVSRNAGLLGASMLAALTFYPLVQAWNLGQAQVFINLFCTLALHLYLQGRKALAGFVLALACLLKPQLALFVLWGLVRRDWRFLAGLVSTGAVGVILAILRYGWHNFFAYFEVLSFLSRRGESYYINHSVNGLLHHLAGKEDPLNFWGFPAFNPVVYTGTMLSTVAFVGLALVVVARPLRDVRDSAALDFSLGLACFTVASPIAWEHHYGLILPAYAVTLVLATRLGRPRATPLLAALGLSYLMTGFSWYWQVGLAHTPFNFLLSLLFFGVLLLIGCMLAVRWHLARSDSLPASRAAASQPAASTETVPSPALTT